MDIDDANSTLTERSTTRLNYSTVFSKSDELTATFYAHSPTEVKQVLRSADFYRDPYTGSIDTLTGYALVSSDKTCFVWQHAQAVKGTPTCYIFSCPRDPNIPPAAPFHAFVPFGSEREPGLILVSSFGEVRFWESIGIGLAGGEHFSTADLKLQPGEDVTTFTRSDAKNYILSTSNGAHYRLILSSSGGKYHLDFRRFGIQTKQPIISRLLPNFLVQSQDPTELGNVSAIALGTQSPGGSRELWSLIDRRIQKWDVNAEGYETLLLDEPLGDTITRTLRSVFGDNLEKDDSILDLELLDIGVDSQDDLLVLISFVSPNGGQVMSVDLSSVHRTHALARIRVTDFRFSVEHLQTLPYRYTFSLPVHTRIHLVGGGKLVAIQFGELVVLYSQESGYMDRLQLSSPKDRTLGVGINEKDNSLLLLTSSMMIRVTLNLDAITVFDPETGHTNIVKSTLTQAVLYGSLPDNPLAFSFSPNLDEESLMQGAEQISRAVLESDADLVRRDHDLTAQLASRKDRLSWLIRFINDNGVLVKMSQRSRQQLAVDAEKLYACDQLWREHNNFLSVLPTHSVLQDTVYTHMSSLNQDDHEDIMRAFFRNHVGNIDKLLRIIPEIAKHAAEQSGRELEVLSEANRVILTVLGGAFEYRKYNQGVYGVELPMIKPWTSQPVIIDIIYELFGATAAVADPPESGRFSDKFKKEPINQLPDLAIILFACIQERLDWLRSPFSGEEGNVERDLEGLDQKFSQLRPEILETLRKFGYEDSAFSLAEQYHDFASLTALCHKGIVYPPEQNPNAHKIQAYLDRFKDEFATELFRWYIQYGELRVLFAQGGHNYEQYLGNFFEKNPHPTISWLYKLGKGEPNPASLDLLGGSKQAKDLETKHLMLSIGKLSYLAQLSQSGVQPVETVLDAFHDGLDIVSVQEALFVEFTSITRELRGKQSLEAQIDAVVKARATKLTDRKALLQTFRNLVRNTLQKRALSVEDMIDGLTLKDNTESVEDYATALHLLARTNDIPSSRKLSAFRSIWRRIYLHDDWDTIRKTANVTDVELNQRYENTALYSTLCIILAQEDHNEEGFETAPDVALMVPSTTEIISRWPGTSPDQIEGLVEDYNLECDRLGELDLNDVYGRIRELAVQHVLWEQDA